MVFCSAGNAYEFPVKYPANLSSTFSITELWPGSNNQFNVVGQSNHGPENDFAAPGTMLYATGYNNGYQPFTGTSAATPVAAGIAALFLSVDMTLTPQEVKDLLIDGADKVGGVNYNWNPQMPGHSLELGYGRVNAFHNLLVLKNDVEGVSMGNIKVNGEIKPSGYKNLYLKDEQITVEITSNVYNNGTYDTKFYEWSYFDNSNYRRATQNTFSMIRDLGDLDSKYKRTKPLTVRNALEGTLDGGTILFGEKNFDVTSRTSPYTENAFIYNPPHVQST